MSDSKPDTKRVGVSELLTQVIDIMRGKRVNRVFPEVFDLVDEIGWRDMDADNLKKFFRLWESYAADASKEAYESADAENPVFSAYNEGYRDAILDLIDDISAVFANMPEPELDLDGWHK